jgi:hypothetical protein
VGLLILEFGLLASVAFLKAMDLETSIETLAAGAYTWEPQWLTHKEAGESALSV